VLALVISGCSSQVDGTVDSQSTFTTSATSASASASATTVRPSPAVEGSALGQAEDPVSVVRVIDGDTLDVRLPGGVERVRLIGIDAPERGECGAELATSFLVRVVDAGEVRLESDVNDRDQFGRLLRYVWVDDVFVNEALVEEGVAIARRYPPDVARAEELEAAQRRAQEDGAGLWSGDLCGPAAEAAIEVTTINYDAAGDDNQNLNGEWIELTNVGLESVSLTGWMVRDESSVHRYQFPASFELEAGATVRLHTGCGDDTTTSLYWCSTGSAVWNNTGDTVFVLDQAGNVVVSRSYAGSR
jgi:micrococcal nuclease